MRHTNKTDQPIHFSDQLNQLTELARRLEEEDLTLEQSIALFEEGQKLIQYCQAQLQKAAQKVQQLTEKEGTYFLETVTPSAQFADDT